MKIKTLELAEKIAQAGLEKKAKDPLILDVRDKSAFADAFVIMSGTNEKQTRAIAQNIETELKKSKIYASSVEGTLSGTWILIDYQHVIAHVFHRETRGYYDLEGLWGDSKQLRPKGWSKELDDEVDDDLYDDLGDIDDEWQ